ncbi:unnamed protein product [Phytophthora fragariaefolia]|uniref:Unnamed protein product n=1 Tax=Phytophthora fragariaefolia TaxID=1490495 RepID=A0A9W7CVW2_9STRA|nr:unnamed protein product [Phytophthora fragariaefolia]
MKFEKELSAVNAAVINDAYKMLKTPNTRVKYLVRHHCHTLQPTYTVSGAPDAGILCNSSDLDALHEIRKEISEHIDAVIDKLGEVYDKDQDLEATKQYAVELQYMVKCAEEIDLREEKLDGY